MTVVLALAACLLALAPVAAARAADELVVGTKFAAPFAMHAEQGSADRWTGLSIELWEGVAAELGLVYRYRERPLKELLREVQAGQLDVAIAALTVTADREEQVDFSQPYFQTSLGVAVRTDANPGVLGVLEALLSVEFLQAVGVLLLMLFGVGALAWLTERRTNAEQFGGSALEGLGSGFWWSAVTMTTVGYGDKAPRSLAGRILGVVWMFTSIIIIAGVTGAIASAFTVQSLNSGIQTVEDVLRAPTATVANSTSERFLLAGGARPVVFDDVEAALATLAAGRVEAVVYDAPVLKYQISARHAGVLSVLPLEFQRESYAIAVPERSERLEAINRALLDFITRPEWTEIQRRYLGE